MRRRKFKKIMRVVMALKKFSLPLRGMSKTTYERVIARELDEVSEKHHEQAKLRYQNGEDVLPTTDLTIWLRDCSHEITTPLQGEISGYIPTWIRGSLIRNGPGSFTVGNQKFQHLFDGSAVLHRYEFKDGKVTYQCKFLQSNCYKKNHEAQRIVISEFGTRATPDPCHSIFKRVASIFQTEELSDNCMISVYPFRDELYTFTENPIIHRVDPKTLDSLGPVDLGKKLSIVHHTSHPHVLEDGTVYNLGMTVGSTGPKYSIIHFPKTTKGASDFGESVFDNAKVVATKTVQHPLYPGYMHTFGITPNYYVLVEQPLCVSVPAKLMSKFNSDLPSATLKWFPECKTQIHVLSRKDGSLVGTFFAEPFFFLHIINQYEDEEHVVIDICAYKDPKMIDCMYLEAMKEAKRNPDYAKMFRGRPVRFVLPLNTTGESENLINLKDTDCKAYKLPDGSIQVIPEIICKIGCETPRINYEKYLGRKYQYFYGISSDVDLDNPGTLVKVDVKNRKFYTWCEDDVFPSEPVFVGAPNPEGEDDGVLLSALLWTKEPNKVALLVLDAQTFREIGRTTFHTPGPIPKCLHGWFTNLA